MAETKPSTVFQWATNEDTAITPAPDSTIRQTGFGKTFVPFQWLNHMFNHIGKWIAWFNQQEAAHGTAIAGHSNNISILNSYMIAAEKVMAHGHLSMTFGHFNPAVNDGEIDGTVEYIVHRHPITGASSLVTLIFPQMVGDPTDMIDDHLESTTSLPESIEVGEIQVSLRPAEHVFAPVHVIDNITGAHPGTVRIDTDGSIQFYQLQAQGSSTPYAIVDQSYFTGAVTNKGFSAFTITYKAAE